MWKVIGFFEGRDGFGRSRPSVYGPLPCKVWVGSHKAKGYRRRKVTGPAPSPPSVDGQAGIYARWIAERDGIALPACYRVTVQHVAFTSAHRTMVRAGRAVPKTEDRVLSVTFTELGADYRAIPNGRVVRIELPNWDFDPYEPVEVIEADVDAANDDWLFADVAA